MSSSSDSIVLGFGPCWECSVSSNIWSHRVFLCSDLWQNYSILLLLNPGLKLQKFTQLNIHLGIWLGGWQLFVCKLEGNIFIFKLKTGWLFPLFSDLLLQTVICHKIVQLENSLSPHSLIKRKIPSNSLVHYK